LSSRLAKRLLYKGSEGDKMNGKSERKVFPMIRKVAPKKWRVVSKSGKNLGETSSLAAAKKRLAEVEMFKHMEKKKR
jgi:hypothetical protein